MKKLLLGLWLFGCAAQVFAQDVAFTDSAVKQAGKYRVTLRLPVEGLFAGEEQQLELRLRDTSRTDALLGAAAVIRARIDAEIVMPAMTAMPRIIEQAHPEAVPAITVCIRTLRTAAIICSPCASRC